MANPPSPSADPVRPVAGQPKSNAWRNVAIGCGAVALLFVIAVGVGVWYVAANLTTFASNMVGGAMVQMVEDTHLPPEQKERIVARIDQVKLDWQEGRVTNEQLGAIVERLAPLLYVGMVQNYAAGAVAASALPEEEKQQAQRTLDRLARGLVEGTIAPEQVDDIFAPLSAAPPDQGVDPKPTPTQEEIRAMLDAAYAAVEEAGIPDAPYDVNIADAVDQAVEEAVSVPAP